MFKFKIMDRTTALSIAGWRYPPPYDFYNPDENSIEGFVDGLINPAFHYYSVWNQDDQLIGYCCFGEDARVLGGEYSDGALDVGGGLRPDLTGQGLGALFLNSVFEFGTARFSPERLRTTVAAFNLRAIKVCKKAEYFQSGRFYNTHLEQSFVILTKTVM
ncbi:MAG: GNAT family N-acetyltransferase [Brevefilum sp.]|nr:GNAT family N-acetyltransferase [Brevefilum sp.]